MNVRTKQTMKVTKLKGLRKEEIRKKADINCVYLVSAKTRLWS